MKKKRFPRYHFTAILSAILVVLGSHEDVMGRKKSDKDHPLIRAIISLPGRPSVMALSPDGMQLAVLHSEGLSLVNLNSQSVALSFPVPSRSILPNLFFADEGSTLYFTNQENQIDRLDLGKNSSSPETWISLAGGKTGGGGIRGMALSSSEHFVAIGVARVDEVVVLDLARKLAVRQIPGVKSPLGIVFSKDGRELLVGQQCQEVRPENPPSSLLDKKESDCLDGTGYVSVIDLEQQTLKTEIEVGNHSGRFCISRDGSRLFIPGKDGKEITAINVVTEEVAEEISLQSVRRGQASALPVTLSLDLDGKRLFAAMTDTPWIAVIALGSQSSKSLNVESSKLEGLIPVPGKPQAVALDLKGTKLLVALNEPVDWREAQPATVQGPGAVAVIELPKAKEWAMWLESYLKGSS